MKPLNDMPYVNRNHFSFESCSLTTMVDILNRNLPEPISFPNLVHGTKQWFGRCPGDPPRQLNIVDLPIQFHRRELTECFQTTIEASTTMKMKPILPPVVLPQQQTRMYNKEPLKVTTVTSTSFLSNGETTNSRLFDALSKHFTIKAEPLRPANNFLNTSSNTTSSWQKYWASSQTQRRRKEAKDSQGSHTRSKHDQSNIIKTYFVTIRDSSSHTNLDPTSSSESSSTIINNITPTKPSSPLVSDQQPFSSKADDQFFLPVLVPAREKTPPPLMNTSRFIERPSSSLVESDDTIINGENIEVNALTTKIYKLPLPSDKQKRSNKSNNKKKSRRPRSLERKPVMTSKIIEQKDEAVRTPSLPDSKKKNPMPPNKSHRGITKKQQQSLSTIISTTARSKYERARWEEPYIGIRFDPPTPPCSPSLFPWPQDSDRDENETPYLSNSKNRL